MQGLRSRCGHLTGTLPTLHPHATSPDVEPASDTPTRGTEPDAIGPAAGPCAIPSHRTPDRAVPSPGRQGRRIMRTPRRRFHTRCPPDAESCETLRETRTRRDRPIPAPPTATPRRTTTPRATPSPQSGSPSEAVLRKATPLSDAVPAKRRPERRYPPERPRKRRCPPQSDPAEHRDPSAPHLRRRTLCAAHNGTPWARRVRLVRRARLSATPPSTPHAHAAHFAPIPGHPGASRTRQGPREARSTLRSRHRTSATRDAAEDAPSLGTLRQTNVSRETFSVRFSQASKCFT